MCDVYGGGCRCRWQMVDLDGGDGGDIYGGGEGQMREASRLLLSG